VELYIVFFFLWLYSPIQALAASMKLSVSLQLLDLGQSVGLLGRVISSSLGLYLYTNTEKRTHNTNTKHPCPEWDSNPRSRRQLYIYSLICLHGFFFFCIVGGWSPNWVHSACRPLTGLLYQPRVIVRMENLVEWMAGETEVLGENLPRHRCHFVHHKSHLTRPGIEHRPPRWEASD
jgi:hypothetical protein